MSICRRKRWTLAALLFLLLLSSACGSLPSSDGRVLSADSAWVLMPLQNTSSHELAGRNVQALLETHLRAKGVQALSIHQTAIEPAQHHAVSAKTGYSINGKVSKWGYNTLTGRRPEVVLELSIHDLATGTLVWQEQLSGSGKGQASLTSVANATLEKMLANITLGTADGSRNAVRLVAENTSSVSNTPPLSGAVAVVNPASVRVTNADINMTGKSLAVYYADNPPVETLAQFDRLILEPDNINPAELSGLLARGATGYAYLSVGEVGPTRAYSDRLDASWIIGSNPSWGSKVMDLSNPDWQAFLLSRVETLVNAGYQGLFLDTLDSYQLAATDQSDRQRQQAGLASTLQKIKQAHPNLRLIANRGFEVLPQVASLLEAVAAESLYASWDNSLQEYLPVNDADRAWLLEKLKNARDEYNIEAIAIDYLPPSRRDEARVVAAKIARQGIVPWISTPGFDTVGVGLLEVVPRKVLMLFDSSIHGEQAVSSVHRLLATPIEYLGYVPVYLDIHKQALPMHNLHDDYAGVVSWTNTPYQHPQLIDWFSKQFGAGMPVVFLGTPGFALSNLTAEAMGVTAAPPLDLKSARVSVQGKLIEFEKPLLPRISAIPVSLRSNQTDNTVHLAFRDGKGQVADLVVTGPWGGYALNPVVIDLGVDELAFWIIDPFEFLKTALSLEDIPAPDVTTENGKRLWFAHIDGDALPSWAEMPGGKLGAEVIEERILNRYRLPHTVSIVEAEMTSVGTVADRWSRMFKTMRRIFSSDMVELASHSFSHPFKWNALALNAESGTYNMPIPGYRYSSAREVAGSIDFINKKLAPAGKRVKVMLWSGDALPTEDALRSTVDTGVLNMNGGFTFINRATPALSQVTPMARTVGDYLQVYAPIMNENVYTNEWRGPFDGFRRVNETFDLTERPRRLKPVNIYYHFYSGTKIAAINALQEVYDYSLQQDVMPVFSSYYITKVADFRRAGVARYLDGTWKLSGLGSVRSLRVLNKNAWPDLSNAAGLAGVRGLHDGNYLHTDGGDTALFTLSQNPPTALHLVSANGQLTHWREQAHAIEFRIKSALPATLELGGSTAGLCQVKTRNATYRGKRTDANTRLFSFTSKDTGNAILECRT